MASGGETSLCKLDVDGATDYYLLSTLHDGGEGGIDIALTDGQESWGGTVSEDELDKLCRKVKMDFDSYVEQTCKALTRKNVGSFNFLYEVKTTSSGAMQLIWKKHMAAENIKFQLGQVTLKPTTDVALVIRKIFEHAIGISSDLQGKINHLEADNQRLAAERATAVKRLEKCVAAKEDLEKDLYEKFAVVINDKKAKIRDLKQELVDYQNGIADDGENGASGPSTSGRQEEASDAETGDELVIPKKEQNSDYDTDEEVTPPSKRSRTDARVKAEPASPAEESLMLDDGMETTAVSGTNRRRRRQPSAKKQTPAKPVIPRTPSRHSDQGPSTSSRKTPMRKSTSGSSKSSGDIEAENLYGEL